MEAKLIGGTAYPIAEVTLDLGETIRIENGSMVYKKNVDLKGKMNGGGVFKAIGRALTSGESFFMTEATGVAEDAVVGIAPANIGKIEKLHVGEKQFRLNTGAYLASDHTVGYKMAAQKLSKAFFGGTGGFFVMETHGEGDLLIASFGDIVELEVTPETPLVIDNEHVLAWESSLDYKIEIASGMFGFTTGEGLVNSFRGSGKVFIQTRSPQHLAESLQDFIITGK